VSKYVDTTVTKPLGYSSIRVEGRFYTKYPYISWNGALPDLTQYYRSGAQQPFFNPVKTEQGHALGHHGAAFTVTAPGSDTQEYWAQTWVTAVGGGVGTKLNIGNLLPSDVQTADHAYQLYLHRNAVEWYVDNELVAVQVPAANDTIVSENSEPYAVGTYRKNWRPISCVMFDMPGPESLKIEEDFDVRNWFFLSGEPAPPRNYRLYDYEADTLLTAGTYDTGTSHKSHPVPVQGYRDVSIYFRADTASTTDGLAVEIYTQNGNWRTYATRTLAANELEVINLTGRTPLLRVAYEPSATGASITDAEVTMT